MCVCFCLFCVVSEGGNVKQDNLFGAALLWESPPKESIS